MKIVLSPAKTLDFENKSPTQQHTQCIFLKQAAKLNSVLKNKTPIQIANLMRLSPKLSTLNWQRNQDWQLPFTRINAKQAIYAFKGDVYVGLDAISIKKENIDFMQNTVRILSGQYGLLKPLDLMQPYRLEMGTKLPIGTTKNLYQFWDASITKALNKEMKISETLLNLASNEYFKVVQPKQLKATLITPIFKDYKNGSLKIISFYAKKARGLMTRYIIDNKIETIAAVKNFTEQGYAFDSNLSTENDLVFTR